MKNPRDLKRLLHNRPISSGGMAGGNGGGGHTPFNSTKTSSEDPFSRSGKPEFLQKVDKDVFKAKYASTTQSNQHVTPECYKEMLIGAEKFAQANLLSATLDRSAETLGKDPETDRAYQAHHKDKLESLYGKNLAPVTGCEKMGYDCAKQMHEAAQWVGNEKKKKDKYEKQEMMKALAENKSTEAGNSTGSASSRE